jgi:hypothetical protein
MICTSEARTVPQMPHIQSRIRTYRNSFRGYSPDTPLPNLH